MPDQSSAADEHALLQEITAPLATLPDDPLPIAADVDFPVVFRGYDRLAVDAYVKRTSQLVAELQSTRSPEAAVRRALERVGEQITGILQRAHDTAEQVTSQSRRDSENRLEVARREAAQITADARQKLKDLDAETDRIWAERLRIVEDARELATQLVALAESAVARFPPAEAEAVAEPETQVEAETPAESEMPPGPAAPPGPEAAPGPAAPFDAESEAAADPEAGPDPDATAVLPPVQQPPPDGPGRSEEPPPRS